MKTASLHDPSISTATRSTRELRRVVEKLPRAAGAACRSARRSRRSSSSIDAHDREVARLTRAELRRGDRPLLPVQALLQPLPLHAAARVGRRLPEADARASSCVQAQRRRHPARRAARLAAGPDRARSSLPHGVAHRTPRSRTAPSRFLMEKTHRHRPRLGAAVLRYETVGAGSRRRAADTGRASGENGRAVLFTTCFVEYSEPDRPRARPSRCSSTAASRVEVGYERCCGMPFLHGGDLASAHAERRAQVVAGLLAARASAASTVVVPGPTCS